MRARAVEIRRRIALVDPMARLWARQPLWVKLLVSAVLVGVAVAWPPYLSRYSQAVLFYPVGVYVLLVLGLNIVVGSAGLLDLGYVAFFAVGAYTTAVLTRTHGWTAWEALPFAILFAMVAGVVLGAPTLRLRGDYLAIVTLGFGEIVRIVAQNSGSLGEARGITGIAHPGKLGPARFELLPLPYYYLTLAAVGLAVVIVVRLAHSRVGRAWSAIREDEDAAEAMGVHTFTMKLWAFAMGSSIGGLAGWIFASKVGFINPDNFPFFFSVIILAAVVLGGMGSIPGVIAGAFAIGALPEYLRDAAAGEWLTDRLNTLTGGDVRTITEYRVLLFGAALVAMMVFRPQGLLPSRRRAAELAEAAPDQALATIPEAVAVGGSGQAGAPVAGAEPGAGPAVVVSDPAAGAAVGGADPAAGPSPATAPDPAEGAPGAVELPAAVAADAVAADDVVLDLRDLTMRFGGVVALSEVSLAVDRGQIFGIIGPNGAGKTTLFNCITGVFHPTSGDIVLNGRSIVGRKPHLITEAGIARTFQNIRLFPELSALENVLVGVDARHATSVPGAVLGLPRHRREERDGRREAERLLAYVGIRGRAGDAARNLSYGDQRRLEIARAIATGPSILLLDEPAAGMNPTEKRSLIGLIRQIRESGLTVMLIEHDMGLVMNVCDRVAVLDFGQKIADGPPAAVRADERVIGAYLGVADAS
ncbi:MAG TPA: ATP-binding cassette domain-containing protein [Acidimicrobiales bacterium]|nr:ATP-binding cassette domain-containing protein [Acidimicrobiales bacterium]